MPDFSFRPRVRKLKAVLKKFQPSRKTIIFILALGLVASSFYWFQLRPAQIKKNCTNLDYIKSVFEKEGRKFDTSIVLAGSLNNIYRWCLVLHGLKPESLFEPASLLDK